MPSADTCRKAVFTQSKKQFCSCQYFSRNCSFVFLFDFLSSLYNIQNVSNNGCKFFFSLTSSTF